MTTTLQPSNMDSLDQALAAMEVGSSFFVEGKTPGQLDMIRRRGYRLGIKLEIRAIKDDEIYRGKTGSRIWHRGELPKTRSVKRPDV